MEHHSPDCICVHCEQAKRRAPSGTVQCLVGRVVEIGDLPALEGKPGMVIECTREQLMAHGRNLAYENVNVRLAFTANNEVRRDSPAPERTP